MRSWIGSELGRPFCRLELFQRRNAAVLITTNPQVTEHGNRRIHQSKPKKKPWFVQIAHFISKLSKFVQKIPWTQSQDHLKIWKDDCQISSFSLANLRNGRPSRWVTTCHDASRFGLAQPPECARPRVAGGSGDCAHGRAPLRAEAQETARKTHLDSAGWNSNEFQFEKFDTDVIGSICSMEQEPISHDKSMWTCGHVTKCNANEILLICM